MHCCLLLSSVYVCLCFSFSTHYHSSDILSLSLSLFSSIYPSLSLSAFVSASLFCNPHTVNIRHSAGPHREKRGWAGDAQLCAGQASLNFDTNSFYRNWLQTASDTQAVGCEFLPPNATAPVHSKLTTRFTVGAATSELDVTVPTPTPDRRPPSYQCCRVGTQSNWNTNGPMCDFRGTVLLLTWWLVPSLEVTR
jgi:hypothetical protein